jgi:hypothetical protein
MQALLLNSAPRYNNSFISTLPLQQANCKFFCKMSSTHTFLVCCQSARPSFATLGFNHVLLNSDWLRKQHTLFPVCRWFDFWSFLDSCHQAARLCRGCNITACQAWRPSLHISSGQIWVAFQLGSSRIIVFSWHKFECFGITSCKNKYTPLFNTTIYVSSWEMDQNSNTSWGTGYARCVTLWTSDGSFCAILPPAISAVGISDVRLFSSQLGIVGLGLELLWAVWVSYLAMKSYTFRSSCVTCVQYSPQDDVFACLRQFK